MEIVLKKLQEIIPYDRNPRKNEKAVNAVAESIRQCGYVAPIIVDEDGVILEYDPRYADVIIERWEKLTGKRAAQICPGLFSYLVVFLLSGGEHNAEAIDGAGPGAV